jgi:hypothetical protein
MQKQSQPSKKRKREHSKEQPEINADYFKRQIAKQKKEINRLKSIIANRTLTRNTKATKQFIQHKQETLCKLKLNESDTRQCINKLHRASIKETKKFTSKQNMDYKPFISKMKAEGKHLLNFAQQYVLERAPEWCIVQDLIDKAVTRKNLKSVIARSLVECGLVTKIQDETMLQHLLKRGGKGYGQKHVCRRDNFRVVFACIATQATKQMLKDELMKMIGFISNLDLDIAGFSIAMKRLSKQHTVQT